MKKFCFFFILLCSFSLFAGKYNSNALGQNLGPVTEDSLYVLEIAENEEILYKDGIEVRKKIISEDPVDNLKTITCEYPDYSESYVYDKSRLVKYSKNEQDNEHCYSYTYQNNHLVFVSYSENGEFKSAEYYLRSSSDNSLIGIKKYSDTSLIGETYLFEENELFSELSKGFILNGDFSITPEGLIQYSIDGITKTYSSEGLILKEEGPDYINSFSYSDNGQLDSSVLKTGNKTIQSEYTDGVLFSQTEYLDNVINGYTVYKPEGMVRTMFSNGKKVADVYYRSDNRKIKEIQYY